MRVSGSFLQIYCSLNIVVYSFTFSSSITLPLVWTNLGECWGLEDIREFVQATGSLWPSQIATVLLICVAQTGKPHCGFTLPLITSSHFIDYYQPSTQSSAQCQG